MRILINLKDWFDYYENFDYASMIEGLDVTVFPSLPYLYLYKDRGVRLGSQKISSFEEGAHTGSISARHLKDFGVEAVILNHRECQIADVENICAKIRNAQKYGMDVILCMSSIDKKEIAKIENVLDRVDTKNLYLAYEPMEELDLNHIQENLEYIKEEFRKFEISYVYGKNITADNVLEYTKTLRVDGLLVSSNALDAENLKRIIESLKKEN